MGAERYGFAAGDRRVRRRGLFTAETSEQQSYELRLANDGSTLKWVAGLYYFDEDQTQVYNLQARPIQESTVNTPMFTRSYAAFGEMTYSLTVRVGF